MLSIFVLISLVTGVFADQAQWGDGCAALASSVPEDLSSWVLGFLTLLSVTFVALGQAQPLQILRMPTFRSVWSTYTLSFVSLLTLSVSTALLLADVTEFVAPDSLQCDVLRVLWVSTPIVVGTASMSAIVLVTVARHNTIHEARVVNRREVPTWKTKLSIPPGDSYNNGCLALKSLGLRVLLHIAWGIGLSIAILFAVRGDVLNGLLSVAGIIAVWSNTGLPEFNQSELSGGQDTSTKNTVSHEFIEINTIGEHYDQTNVLIQPVPPTRGTSSIVRSVTARMYAVSNAHAAATDFKGIAFKLDTFQPVSDSVSDLARAVVEQSDLVRSSLLVVFRDLDFRNADQRLAFTALVASVLDIEPWENRSNHRTRIQALAIAEAWFYKLMSRSGHKVHQDLEFPHVDHEVSSCNCPIHKWGVKHNIRGTALEEAKHLLGNDVKLPIKQDDVEFANQLWSEIVTKVGGNHDNTSLLISIYLNALHARGSLDLRDQDYFPVFDLDVESFTEDDFVNCCSKIRNVEHKKPQIGGSAGGRQLSYDYIKTSAVWYGNQRTVVVPFHPKVITHVANRVLWRSILVQATVWFIISLKLLGV